MAKTIMIVGDSASMRQVVGIALREEYEVIEAGAKAWVTKPFQPPILLAAIAKLVLP